MSLYGEFFCPNCSDTLYGGGPHLEYKLMPLSDESLHESGPVNSPCSKCGWPMTWQRGYNFYGVLQGKVIIRHLHFPPIAFQHPKFADNSFWHYSTGLPKVRCFDDVESYAPLFV